MKQLLLILLVLATGCTSDEDKTSGSGAAASSGNSSSAQKVSLNTPVYEDPNVIINNPDSSNITALWANEGGDKVRQDELRASNGADVTNSAWDGSKIRLNAAKNEVVSFNVVLEAKDKFATAVSVRFNRLVHVATGETITGKPVDGEAVFDWVDRNVELFFVRYLQIKGLSSLSYDSSYDERHIPSSMRRPLDADKSKFLGVGDWKDRPGANKFYPEIAVPNELVKTFDIDKNRNQSIWADIYVPKFSTPGLYRGKVSISENGITTREIAVELNVRKFSLPDEPNSKTMLYIGYQDINERYTGKAMPKPNTENERIGRKVRDRHYLLAHRHKISLIDQDVGSEVWSEEAPRPEWIPRLDGTLFTPSNGYAGPGAYTGNGVYSIGTYGTWSWRRDEEEESMHRHTDAWMKWFTKNFPETETFLYLIDESKNYDHIETLAKWMKTNPGIGGKLQSFATVALNDAVKFVPDLDIPASWYAVAPKDSYQAAYDKLKASHKKYYQYNGKRPASGSFATEDDGVALRELAWGQYKMGVDRWLFWEGTYYNNYQGDGIAPTNLFKKAQTMGYYTSFEDKQIIDHDRKKYAFARGETGDSYSNGDGVLFYPGTDKTYPEESYKIDGPIASLRLKHWRRGIQDVDYLALAEKIDPVKTRAIVMKMIPKVLWENDIQDPSDPTWKVTDVSWSSNPDDWEKARAELAEIIEKSTK